MSLAAKKSAIGQWVSENYESEFFIDRLVDAAAKIFCPPRFSKAITSKRLPVSRTHRRVIEFMQDGRWVTDDDLAAFLHRRVEAAGARRRDLRKLGYVVASREVSKGTWQHRLVSSHRHDRHSLPDCCQRTTYHLILRLLTSILASDSL
jgi:hypothetical protein